MNDGGVQYFEIIVHATGGSILNLGMQQLGMFTAAA